jgi:hypothetical protein
MPAMSAPVKCWIQRTCGDGQRCAPPADYREGTHASRQTPHAKAARGCHNGSRDGSRTRRDCGSSIESQNTFPPLPSVRLMP